MPTTDRLYLRGKIYWCWYYDQRNRLIRKSTKCRDRRAAASVLARYERAAQGAPEAARDRPPHTVDDAVNAFVEDGCIDLSPQTVRMYEEKGAQLIRVIGQLDVNDLSVEKLQGYIKQRLKEPSVVETLSDGQVVVRRLTSRSTIAKELVTLRQALKTAHQRGHFAGDPRAVFPKFRVQYTPRSRYLTHEEFQKLIAELEPHRQLWLVVAVWTGGRDSEVDGLCWEHVNWAHRTVFLPGTKTKKSPRHVPLHPLLAKVLAPSRQVRGHVVGEWMNVRRDLARACDRAGIAHVTPNDLRRTCASWLKQEGVDSAVVARIFGHSTTRMVDLVYGQIDAATLARAMERLPGGDCAKGVKDDRGRGGRNGSGGQPEIAPTTVGDAISAVLGPGIEPGTRGFSIRTSSAPDARIARASERRAGACEKGVKALRVLRGGKR